MVPACILRGWLWVVGVSISNRSIYWELGAPGEALALYAVVPTLRLSLVV